MKPAPVILAIGIIVLAFGLLNHFVLKITKGSSHLNLYVAILGVIIVAVGLAVMMMGNRKAA